MYNSLSNKGGTLGHVITLVSLYVKYFRTFQHIGYLVCVQSQTKNIALVYANTAHVDNN